MDDAGRNEGDLPTGIAPASARVSGKRNVQPGTRCSERIDADPSPDPRSRSLNTARWTLVDSFEQGGARYIVARESRADARGLAGLSDRERQVVRHLLLGQSTKETAYALGISDVTVRVLTARAAEKLGVRSRAALLGHPDVRALRPESKIIGGA